MASLLAAAIFFVGIHFVISGSPLRGKIVASLGDGPFRGLFSLHSLIGIVWLSRAYSQAEYIQLWGSFTAFGRMPWFWCCWRFSSWYSRSPHQTRLLSEVKPY